MRKTDVQHELFALLCGTVTDTVDFEFFLIALRNADNHVVDQRTGKAVQRVTFVAFFFADHVDRVAVDFDAGTRVNFLAQRVFGAFDRHDVVIADGDGNTGRNLDRQFAYS